MSLSVGAATDYLYGLAQQAVAGVTVNGQPAVAVDGQPGELAFAMFIVGLSDPPPDVQAETPLTRSWDGLGGQRVVDIYDVPHVIDVRVPGTTSQKVARDIVETIFNTFWTLLKADRTLGGALRGGDSYAQIGEIRFTPSNIGTVAEPGRRQLASFPIHCRDVTN